MSAGTVTRWKVYIGDTDQIEVQLSGILSIAPGAAVSVVAIRRGVFTAITGASVTDLAERIISIPLVNFLVAPLPGVYELRVTLDDITWPDQGRAELEVVANA